MKIQYVLTKAEYDELKEANTTLNRVKTLLEDFNFYDHEKTIPAMVLGLIEIERNLTRKIKEVAR